MSVEHRWQDLASMFSFPTGIGMGEMSSHAAAAAAHYSPHYPYQVCWKLLFLVNLVFLQLFVYSLNQASGPMSQHSQLGHHHHHHPHSAVLHNASLADIASQPAGPHHYGSNLGSAVASSMHLTNSTSETDAGNQTYKMEHDPMMYFTVSLEKVRKRFADGTKLDFFFFDSMRIKVKWTKPTMDSWTPSWVTRTYSWTWTSVKVSYALIDESFKRVALRMQICQKFEEKSFGKVSKWKCSRRKKCSNNQKMLKSC